GWYMLKFDKENGDLLSLVRMDMSESLAATYNFFPVIDTDNSIYLWCEGSYPDTMTVGTDTIVCDMANGELLRYLMKYDTLGNNIWHTEVRGYGFDSTYQTIIGRPAINEKYLYISGETKSYPGSDFMGFPTTDNALADHDFDRTKVYARFRKSDGEFVSAIHLHHDDVILTGEIFVKGDKVVGCGAGGVTIAMTPTDTIFPTPSTFASYPYIVEMDTALTQFNWGVAAVCANQPRVFSITLDDFGNAYVGGSLNGNAVDGYGNSTSIIGGRNFFLGKIAFTNTDCTCEAPASPFVNILDYSNSMVSIHSSAVQSASQTLINWGDSSTTPINQLDTLFSHQYNSEGPFNLCVQSVNNCAIVDTCVYLCEYPVIQTILDNYESSTIQISNQANTPYIQMSMNWGDADSLQFSNPDTTIAHVYSCEGPFSPCLKAWNNCGVVDTCFYVCEYPVIQTSLDNYESSTIQISNQANTPYIQMSMNWGDADSLQFSNPDTTIAHVYSWEGPFSPCLKAWNNCGVVDTCFYVCEYPVIQTSLDNYESSTIQISYQANTPYIQMSMNWGDADSLQFSNPDTTIAHVYSWEGPFTPCLKAWNNCGVVDTCFYVCEEPEVSASYIEFVNATLLVNGTTSTPFADYIWYWGDGDSTIYLLQGTDISHLYSGNGPYDVLFVGTNNCASDTAMLTNLVRTPTFETPHGVTISPNPFIDIVNLNIPSELVGSNLEVFEPNGKLVFSQKLNNQQTELSFNFLKSGLFLFVIQSKEKTYKFLIIKK
ncbi:MAG: T9SS type A sorting domain-containing protein, partial [Bacteroidales bacterium]|nr:T9SS type A sorting domain-containing protein [Bacteroidales bacterium]